MCLELVRPEALEVGIAGSFNDWHSCVTPKTRLNDGKSSNELALPPGRYEYRFAVDGEWADDPRAGELIPNPFGTANAVLVVAAGNSPVAARPVSAPPATTPQTPSTNSTPRVTRAAPEPPQSPQRTH